MVIEKVVQQVQNFLGQFKIAPNPQDHPLNAGKPQTSTAPYSGLPLEIGNELLITDEMVKLNNRLSNARGRVVIIDEIPPSGQKMVKASAFGIQVNVDVPMAQQMRQAYLVRQQGWSAG